MSSEDMGLVQSQRLENGLNSHHHRGHHLVFPNDEALRFTCGAPVAAVAAAATQLRVGAGGGDSAAGVPKTRDLSGYIEERFFATPPTDFHRGIFTAERTDPRNWSASGTATAAAAETPSVDGSEADDDDDDDDDGGGGEDEDMDDDDDEVGDGKGNTCNNRSNGEDRIGNGNGKQKRDNDDNQTCNLDHFGVNVTLKDSRELPIVAVAKAVSYNIENGQNAVTVAENDGAGNGYYSQYFHGAEGSSASGHKDNNGCGFSGRKESCLYLSESGDSLRSILSDPVTGALMDDAMILPCGHSFGGGGVQHVIRMKSCYTCSYTISEDLIAPNLSLRAAVQAFRREEELQIHRSAKRKRERFDQEKSVYGDPSLMELPRGKGVQFPFNVTDRVVIKGNKRTPQRFVGREAVVTTQCLNGWYVVKTLDNAESVKLQYRSLAKVPEDPLSKPMSSKMVPNWL